jgi:hypothetical protein
MMSGNVLVHDEFWRITGSAQRRDDHDLTPDPLKLAPAKAIIDRFEAQVHPRRRDALAYPAVQAYPQALIA